MQISFAMSDRGELREEFSFEIPSDFGSPEIYKICRDGKILSKVSDENSEMICQLLEQARNGDHPSAAKLAREMGFTEERFEKEGGGIWLALAVAAAALLYSQSAY